MLRAGLRGAQALLVLRRLRERNARAIIGDHAPTVGRMGFADVNGQECNLVAIASIKRLKGPKLGPKRPSCKAPEHEYDRPFAANLVEVDGCFTIDRRQDKFGREFAHAWSLEN